MRFAAALACALLCAPAAQAADREELVAGLAELRASDHRLQSIGWKLATGNARFCDNARPAIGLLLLDMAGFTDPAEMREVAGLDGDIAIEAAAAGSPAAAQGLAAGQELLSIDGAFTSALPAVPPRDWKRVTGLHDAIDASLDEDGAVALSWRGADGTARSASVAGVPACPSRYELAAKESRAVADGKRVVIGRDFAGTGYAEEECAAAVAHELAHNILAHRAWLDAEGRKRKNIRLTEREADRLMPWLLANAGYPPEAAVAFMQRWGPRHGGGLFRKRTHDGWDERVEFIEAELPRIRALMASEGAADWRAHFKREI